MRRYTKREICDLFDAGKIDYEEFMRLNKYLSSPCPQFCKDRKVGCRSEACSIWKEHVEQTRRAETINKMNQKAYSAGKKHDAHVKRCMTGGGRRGQV